MSFTYWATRDQDPDTGQLSPNAKIWLREPKRMQLGRGFIWYVDDNENFFYGEWELAGLYHHARTVPDDSRQCLRIEGDALRQPEHVLDRPNAS